MKERPIIFSSPMINAILEGPKTQTRRIMKYEVKGPQASLEDWSTGVAGACHCYNPHPEKTKAHVEKLKGRIFPFYGEHGHLESPPCPYGFPGDRLWVRETWCWNPDLSKPEECKSPEHCIYRADGEIHEQFEDPDGFEGWKSPRYMPRYASRINLEITDIRVERLQDISIEDVHAEGVERWRDYEGGQHLSVTTTRNDFHRLWDSINGKKHPWSSNPRVWCISFKKL